MQNNDITYRLKAVDEASPVLESVKKKADQLTSSVNRLSAANSGAAKAYKASADAFDGLSESTDNATSAHKNYMAHIAKTTVLSALVNKGFMMMVESMGKAVQQADLISNFPSSMGALGLSTEDASEAFAKLKTYTQSVGGDLAKATNAVQRFVGVNKNVKASVAIFAGLNNALIAGGADAALYASGLEQAIQAYSRGAPMAIEWKSIMTAAAGPMGLVAKQMGFINASALGDALTAGEVSMNSFMTTLAKMGTGTGEIANLVTIKMQGIEFAATVMKNTLTNGLTNIYLAVGRQNIVKFLSFLTQVIAQVTNWVVVLINWVLSLINILDRLFGGDGVDQLSKDTGDVNKNLDAGAGSAGALGDSLADADKSAKSLNKSLASFDKMNVLAEKTSSGKDDAAGAGGAGGLDAASAKSLLDVFDSLGEKMEEISGWAKIFAGILLALAANSLIKKIFNVDLIGDFIKGIDKTISYLAGIPGRIVGFVKNVGTALVGWYKDAKPAVVKFANDVIDSSKFVTTGLSIIWGTLGPKISEQFNILKTNVIAILNKLGIVEFFTNIKNAVIARVTDLVTGIEIIFIGIKTAITGALSTVSGYVVGVFNNLKAIIGPIVGGVVTAIVDKFNAIKNGIVSGVNTAINWVVTTFTTLKDKIVTAIAPIIEVGKKIATAIISGVNTYVLPIIGPIAEIGKSIGKGIVESIRVALGPVATVVAGAFNGLRSVLGSVGNVLGSILSSGFDKVKKVAHNLGESISKKVGEGLHKGMMLLGGILIGGLTIALRDGPAALMEKFNGFITMLLNGPQILTSILTALQTMFNTVVTQTGPIIAAVTQIITIFANTIITTAPVMISSFLTAVLRMIQVLLAPETINKIITATITLLTNIITTLANILPKIVDAMITALTTIISVITQPDTLSKIIKGTIDLLLKIIDALITTLPKIIDAMITAFTKIIEVITKPETITKIIDGTIELLLKILIALIDALPDIIDGMVQLLTSLIDTIVRPDILTKIIDATIQLIITIALALIENLPKIIEAGVKLIIALATALTKPETLAKLLTAVWDIVVAIFNAFFSPEAIKKWAQIGTDLVKGLWEGIKNMGSWIGEKIKGFGDGVVKSLKNFFGIKSPSKIMRDQVGAMIGEGIAEGIQDSTKSAVNAAEAASESVLGVFSGMESSIGGLKTDFAVDGSVSRSLNIKSADMKYSEMPKGIDAEAVASLENNSAWVDKISSQLNASDSKSQPLQLTVQIGEERIATKMIELINEKTQMSGRNAILV